MRGSATGPFQMLGCKKIFTSPVGGLSFKDVDTSEGRIHREGSLLRLHSFV